MYTSTTKQIADKMKIITTNLELGFLSKKCRRPHIHHFLAKGLKYFPLTYRWQMAKPYKSILVAVLSSLLAEQFPKGHGSNECPVTGLPAAELRPFWGETSEERLCGRLSASAEKEWVCLEQDDRERNKLLVWLDATVYYVQNSAFLRCWVWNDRQIYQ